MQRDTRLRIEFDCVPIRALVFPLREDNLMSSGALPGIHKPRYYVGIAAFMSLMVLAGFWPTYFGQFVSGIPNRPWIVHLHGWIFVGWMMLLVTQVALAAKGKIAAHRSLGTLGVAYGFLIFAMGIVVSIVPSVARFQTGEQTLDEVAGFLIIPLGDMVLFGAFFIPAVLYRRRPELHKRLMLLATNALLFAAAGRLGPYVGDFISSGLWFSPVFIGMAYDLWTRRRVHPVYFVGLAAMAIVFTRLFLVESEGWLRIGRVIVHTFS